MHCEQATGTRDAQLRIALLLDLRDWGQWFLELQEIQVGIWGSESYDSVPEEDDMICFLNKCRMLYIRIVLALWGERS